MKNAISIKITGIFLVLKRYVIFIIETKVVLLSDGLMTYSSYEIDNEFFSHSKALRTQER